MISKCVNVKKVLDEGSGRDTLMPEGKKNATERKGV